MCLYLQTLVGVMEGLGERIVTTLPPFQPVLESGVVLGCGVRSSA
jgi:hypothetical protein